MKASMGSAADNSSGVELRPHVIVLMQRPQPEPLRGMPPAKPSGTVSLFNKFAGDAARTRLPV
jgi:hypothetical protein